jgi:outer membrane immunogenic protein
MAPVVAPTSWTGFYVGAGWGYGVWDMNSTSVFPSGSQGTTNNGGRGWLGMADVGYDYQFAIGGWNLVAGVLADYDFGNMTGTSSFQLTSFGAPQLRSPASRKRNPSGMSVPASAG